MREKLSSLRGYICVGGPTVDTGYVPTFISGIILLLVIYHSRIKP